ncbi:MAG: short-chain dehydrogenase/reductase [Myxococcales bacterium]|nr:short-chain dehydrogenase/reductase [Myxococcales bacterium]
MDKRAWLGAAAGGGLAVGWWAVRRSREQDLRGRVAVVTGGSRGLGYRLADLLARAGCSIAICSRGSHEIKEAGLKLAGYGVPVLARAVDVSDPVAVTEFIGEIEQHFGRIDILVNNAGIIQAGPVEEMALHDFRQAMDIDFWGVVYGTRAALPGMRLRGEGTIVNITSIGGEISVPHMLPYSCAKAAARAYSEGMSAELERTGVKVVTVVPWLMRTGSAPYVFYKGNVEAEMAMFEAGLAVALSVDADRAARRIVKGIRRRERRVTIGIAAKLAREAHALAPGLLSRAFGLMTRFMPKPTGNRPSMAVRGTTLQVGS